MARCCRDRIAAVESAVEGEPVAPAVRSAGLRLTRAVVALLPNPHDLDQCDWKQRLCLSQYNRGAERSRRFPLNQRCKGNCCSVFKIGPNDLYADQQARGRALDRCYSRRKTRQSGYAGLDQLIE
jgi:hypothetical protein